LRDSSESRRLEDRDTGVQVVAPTDNSTNKWGNIIKVKLSSIIPFFDYVIFNVYFFNLEIGTLYENSSKNFICIPNIPKVVLISNQFLIYSNDYPTYKRSYRILTSFQNFDDLSNACSNCRVISEVCGLISYLALWISV